MGTTPFNKNSLELVQTRVLRMMTWLPRYVKYVPLRSTDPDYENILPISADVDTGNWRHTIIQISTTFWVPKASNPRVARFGSSAVKEGFTQWSCDLRGPHPFSPSPTSVCRWVEVRMPVLRRFLSKLMPYSSVSREGHSCRICCEKRKEEKICCRCYLKR